MRSSNPEYIEESYQIIDKLLLTNGYVEPCNFIKSRSPKCSHSSRKVTGDCVPLSLPYLTETASSNIMHYIDSHDLPIRVTFTPGQKIRDIFCCSRPNNKIMYFNKKYQIFPRLTGSIDCTATGIVYKIICKYCNQVYIEDTSRSLHERLMDHSRYANSLTNYPEEALSIHCTTYHINCKPDLPFCILERVRSTVLRKIREAFHIVKGVV